MDKPISPSERMEQQLKVWLRLASAIEQAQAALLRGDACAYERSTEIQAECCRQFQVGGLDGATVSTGDAVSIAPAALLMEVEQARRRVRHLNQVHAALLRRASRGLCILRNLLSQTGAPYAPPAPLHQPPLSTGRG